jgi:hypothetical protein
MLWWTSLTANVRFRGYSGHSEVLKRGDRVQVIHGPLKGSTAIYATDDDPVEFSRVSGMITDERNVVRQ